MEKVLKAYLKRLSNLSGNNRSLLLKRLLKDQFVDLHDFDFEMGVSSFSIIYQLLERKTRISICDELNSRERAANDLSSRLKKIDRVERFLFEERGAKDLYIGWPFVSGKFSDGTTIRCPLLFFPIELFRGDGKWHIKQRQDVNVTFNKSFLLAYSYYNETPLDEDLVETVIDDYEKDSIVFRTKLYELLRGSGVEIDFNRENFEDVLQPFPDKTKAQLEKSGKNGVLKLEPYAIMGIFPQAGSYLVPDYVKLLERNEEENLASFFEKKRIEEGERSLVLADRIAEENTFTPLPLDAYQEYAIREIKKGNSMVVQGPPGTGKSQLIGNLICDFIARGKKVLVVCQKKAALDVVYDRLKQKGLDDFMALVHDFKSDRKPIYEQVDSQVENIDMYQQKNNSLDAIHLERTFVQASRRIDQIIEELQEFREALYDEKECGKSAKELYLSCDLEQPHFPMNLEYRSFTFEKLKETERKFRSYLKLYLRFEKRTNYWTVGPSYAGFGTKELSKIQEVLRELAHLDQKIKDQAEEMSMRHMDFENVHYFSQKLPEILEIELGLKEKVVYKVFQQLSIDKPSESINWLVQRERNVMACFKGQGLEESLKKEELGRFQEVLQSAIKARKSPLGWMKWRLFSKEKTILKRVLVANNLKSTKEAFATLLARMDNRLNFEHTVSEIMDKPWLHNFPEEFRKIDFQDWFYWQKAGLNIYNVTQAVRSVNDFIPPAKYDHEEYLMKIKKLFQLSDDLQTSIEGWRKFLSLHQIRSIVLGKEDVENLITLLRKDFDAICKYHSEKEQLSGEEKKILSQITEVTAEEEEAIALFQNSLRLAWLDHLESKYPNLRDVTSGQIEELADELREQIQTKRAVSKEILLLKAREKTYEDVTYNRLNNRVTYRDLQHQVTKKRLIWPIRKVISEHSEELLALLPCWMCSPESASAIFPMDQIFDLVIFDEASQCYAERGIPAMYRARQIVVAGDSKQLQPSDLYRARWEEDQDEVELNVDSLLDLAKHYLPETRLSGHYRSKSLELIEFSNKHFYDDKLRLLPDFEASLKRQPAIEYRKVEGTWDEGVNSKEATEVAELALDFLAVDVEKSIGIVAFSFRQQQLIHDRLDELSLAKGITIPDSLFVKNIENVQGDERDIILFSIGYAADKKGKFRMQFGTLNVAGGENRLNVAITRAKEKVIVVASILPQQLAIEETKNAGPKLLKKYLEHAYQVSQGKWQASIPEMEAHNVDWFLRNRLQASFSKEGYQLEKDVPFADLSLRSAEKYLGLILTDDERYFQALSPKQIYAFQHFHLAMKKWPHIRVHSRDFWIDKTAVMERIERLRFNSVADEPDQ